MKVLITGASGFIGSYLIDALKPRAGLVVLDLQDPKVADVAFYRGNLASPYDIYGCMALHRPTHIVHLGSLLAGPCEDNPCLGFAVNFESTLHLLNAAEKQGVERFIMTSSISVFGKDCEIPVKDDGIKEPGTVYGQTKLACENLLRWYSEKGKLSVGALRFPWVFGPGRENGITALYSSKLIDSIAAGESLSIDNPEEKGDWVYVKDAVKALLLLLDARETGQVAYNIMSGCYTIREAVDIAKGICPELRVSYTDNKIHSPYPAEYDDTPARHDLGWAPDYSLRDAIKEHINYARS